MSYPLLIKGFYANQNGTAPSVVGVATIPINWNQTITEGRGDMVMLDVVASNVAGTPSTGENGKFSLLIAGNTVIDNNEITNYYVQALARSFEFLMVRQKPGQTIQLSYIPVGTMGAVVHVYHENKFAIESIVQARRTSILKQRLLNFYARFASNTKLLESPTFTIPSAQGNVVGLQLLVYTDSAVDVIENSLITLFVDGISVIEEANTSIFQVSSNRALLVFPILIRPGSTFKLQANTDFSAAGSFLSVQVKLYLDDDKTGTKQYV